MRSRTNAFAHVLAIAIVALVPTTTLAQSSGGVEPTQEEIVAALDNVRADPNLARERKTRTLRWLGDDEEEEEKPEKPSSFFEWIKNFFVWLGQLSRVLMWVVGGVLALGLLWFLFALVKGIRMSQRPPAPAAPTHVRDLDIRPESLPDNIGSTAFDLWQRGEHRAALALLYRGSLSRLVHVHRVPIRDASTEGDCLALAAQHLPPQRSEFVAKLIRTWQRATYGGHDPQTEEVEQLCAGFDAAFAPAPAEARST